MMAYMKDSEATHLSPTKPNSTPKTVNEKWTWERVQPAIATLADRPEFQDGIHLMKYLLRDDGTFVDELNDLAPVEELRRVQYLYSILSYYAAADPLQPSGKLIKFNQLDGGAAKAAFSDQLERQLKSFFDKDMELVKRLFTAVFSAEISTYGDLSFTVEFLPGFPVTFVYHAPDEEFESECKVFFDATANHYLPTEICDFLVDIFAERLEDEFRKSS
jgi:hypothetical protein